MEWRMKLAALLLSQLMTLSISSQTLRLGQSYYRSLVAGTIGDTLVTIDQVFFQGDFIDYYRTLPAKFEKDGKTYCASRQYVNYLVDGDSTLVWYQNYYRQDGQKMYFLESPESADEILIADFGLKQGDVFDSPLYGPMRVESVCDTTLNNNYTTRKKFILRSIDTPDFTDEWISDAGSMRTGLISPVLAKKINNPVLAYSCVEAPFLSQDVNTSFLKTRHYCAGRNEEAGSNTAVWSDTQDAPWSCEFIGDTLHVRGYVFENAASNTVTDLMAFVQGDHIYLERYTQSGNVKGKCWCIHDAKFPGFAPGTYHVEFNQFQLSVMPAIPPHNQYILSEHNMDITIECKGNTTTTYHPFVEEGKVWNYHHGSMMPQYEYDYTYEIRGQEYVGDGLPCKKMFKDGQFYASIYENDSQVYYYDSQNGALVLLYDFDCKAGDEIVANSQSVHILKTGEKDYLGTKRKVIWWLPTDEYQETVRNIPEEEIDNWISEGCERDEFGQWIEGIGSNLDLFACTPMPGNNDYLTTCYVGDVKLYDYEWPGMFIDEENLNNIAAHRPFIETDKVWKVGWIPEGETVAKRLSYYYFDGDTIVGGKSCQRMMCHDIFAKEDEITESTPEVTAYVGAFYEENRQVYGTPKGRDEFVMLYDFGANVGDKVTVCGSDTASVPFWYPETIDVEVVGKGVSNTEFYKGNYTDVRLNETYRWLEGVGSVNAPIENIHYKNINSPYRNCLMSCSVGDELIYQCAPDLVDGVSEPDLEGKKRIDFTHVVKTKPKVPARNAAESQTILLEGEFNSHVLDLNLINLHDEYTVSITSLAGEQVYTKQIRANALLGLNIDITACELTDYEIRVENDNEYYLATFRPVVNDIIAVSDGHASSAKGIYDLTGRRLTTEPKQGMYIRDGKKVMIK